MSNFLLIFIVYYLQQIHINHYNTNLSKWETLAQANIIRKWNTKLCNKMGTHTTDPGQ